MKKSDVIIGATLLGLAISIYVVTLSFPREVVTPGTPTASFFPRMLAVALAALSIALIVFGIRAKPDEAAVAIKRKGIIKVIIGIVLTTAYVIMVPHLDFFILTPFLLASIMAVMGERDWKMLVGVPLLFTLLAYFVFFRLFSIMFPTKIFT